MEKDTPIVPDYEFDVGKFMEIVDNGTRQKYGTGLTPEEETTIYNALKQDIRNYGLILDRAGIDPKQFVEQKMSGIDGERDIYMPTFVNPTQRQATDEEMKILKEKNPLYTKVNPFGQVVPMNTEEAKAVGFVARNSFTSGWYKLMGSLGGLGLMAVEQEDKTPAGALKTFVEGTGTIALGIAEKSKLLGKAVDDLAKQYVPKPIYDTASAILKPVGDIARAITGGYEKAEEYLGEKIDRPVAEFAKGVRDKWERLPQWMRLAYRITSLDPMAGINKTLDVIVEETDTQNAVKESIKYWNEEAGKRSQLQALDFDLATAIENKDWDKVLQAGIYGTLENAPTLAVMIGTGIAGNPNAGLLFLGATSAGDKYGALMENTDLDTSTKTMLSLGSGALTYATEKFIGFGHIIKHSYKTAAKTGATNAWKTALRRIVIDGLGEGSLDEYGEEFIENLVGGLLDYATGVTGDSELATLLTDSINAGVIGGLSGGMFGVFVNTMSTPSQARIQMAEDVGDKVENIKKRVLTKNERQAEIKKAKSLATTQEETQAVEAKMEEEENKPIIVEERAEEAGVKYKKTIDNGTGERYHVIGLDSETEVYVTDDELASADFAETVAQKRARIEQMKTPEGRNAIVEKTLNETKETLLSDETLTKEERAEINEGLNVAVDDGSAYDFIVEEVKAGKRSGEIVSDLKKRGALNKGTRNYVSLLARAYGLDIQFMTPNEFGEIQGKIESGKATLTEAQKYRAKLKEERGKFQEKIKEVKSKMKQGVDSRRQAIKDLRAYVKGLAGNFTLRQAVQIAHEVSMIKDSKSLEIKTRKIIEMIDKAVNKALDKIDREQKNKLKKQIKEKSRLSFVRAFNEHNQAIRKAIKDRVPFAKELGDLLGAVYQRVGMDMPTEIAQRLSDISGKTLNDLSLTELEFVNDSIAWVDNINDKLHAVIYENKSLAQIAVDGALRVVDNASTRRQKTGKWFNTIMAKWRAFSGQSGSRMLMRALVGMDIDENGVIQIHGLERVMHYNVFLGEYAGQAMLQSWVDGIERQLTSKFGKDRANEIAKMLFGKRQAFSNYGKGAIPINLKSGKIMMTPDTLLYLYMLLQNDKARISLLDKNAGFFDEEEANYHTGLKEALRKTSEFKRRRVQITEEDATMIEDMVRGNEEWFGIVDTIKNLTEEIYEQVNTAYENIYGRQMPRDNNYIKRVRDIGDMSTKPKSGLMQSIFNLEEAGFTREAVVSDKPFRLFNLSNILGRMMVEGSRFAGMAEPLFDLKLMLHSDLDEETAKKLGGQTLSEVMKNNDKFFHDKWVKYMEQLSSINTREHGIISLIQKMRRVGVSSILRLKPFVWIKQLPSFLLAVAGAKRYLGFDGWRYMFGEFGNVIAGKGSITTEEMYKIMGWTKFRRYGFSQGAAGAKDIDVAHRNQHMLISDFDFYALKCIASGVKKYLLETGQYSDEKLNEMTAIIVNHTQPDFLWSTRSTGRMHPTMRLLYNFYSGISVTSEMAAENLMYMAYGGDKKDALVMSFIIRVLLAGLYRGIDMFNSLISGYGEGKLTPKKIFSELVLQNAGYDWVLQMFSGAISKLLGEKPRYGEGMFEAPFPAGVRYAIENTLGAFNDIGAYIQTNDKKNIISLMKHGSRSVGYWLEFTTGKPVPMDGINKMVEYGINLSIKDTSDELPKISNEQLEAIKKERREAAKKAANRAETISDAAVRYYSK